MLKDRKRCQLQYPNDDNEQAKQIQPARCWQHSSTFCPEPNCEIEGEREAGRSCHSTENQAQAMSARRSAEGERQADHGKHD